jgi:hypothetical protein
VTAVRQASEALRLCLDASRETAEEKYDSLPVQ